MPNHENMSRNPSLGTKKKAFNSLRSFRLYSNYMFCITSPEGLHTFGVGVTFCSCPGLWRVFLALNGVHTRDDGWADLCHAPSVSRPMFVVWLPTAAEGEDPPPLLPSEVWRPHLAFRWAQREEHTWVLLGMLMESDSVYVDHSHRHKLAQSRRRLWR